MLKLILTDLNPSLVAELRRAFADYPDVTVEGRDIVASAQVHGADAWVTPTNSRGIMSGGIDAAVKAYYAAQGLDVESALQYKIRADHGGKVPVGRAVVIDVQALDPPFPGIAAPRFLIATPTMEGEKDDLRRTKNTARAIAAAFQAIHVAADVLAPGEVAKVDAPQDLTGDAPAYQTVVVPGLGTGTGRVSPAVGAELMLVGYKLFRRGHFPDWMQLDEVLAELLADAPIPNAAAVAVADQLPI